MQIELRAAPATTILSLTGPVALGGDAVAEPEVPGPAISTPATGTGPATGQAWAARRGGGGSGHGKNYTISP